MLPFGRKYTAEYINMAHLLGIKHFEISTESSCYSEDFIANGEIYSIHAPKNILDETDLRRLRSELERLRDFCETVQCHRLVFHPNVNVESNDSVFSVLSEVMADYAICIENVNEDLDGLMPLLVKYGFKIVWDISHALFHEHIIEDKAEMIEHFHVRGFSYRQKYVTLQNSEERITIPHIKDAVYILEYPYRNMLELLIDWKNINQLFQNK